MSRVTALRRFRLKITPGNTCISKPGQRRRGHKTVAIARGWRPVIFFSNVFAPEQVVVSSSRLATRTQPKNLDWMLFSVT